MILDEHSLCNIKMFTISINQISSKSFLKPMALVDLVTWFSEFVTTSTVALYGEPSCENMILNTLSFKNVDFMCLNISFNSILQL